MTDFEIMGRIVAWLAFAAGVLLGIRGILWLAWHVYCEIKGWPRIRKAMRMLDDSERTPG